MDPELVVPTVPYDEDDEQQQKRQAEAKAKQEAKAAKSKQGASGKCGDDDAARAKAQLEREASGEPGVEAAAPPPPMAEAEAKAMPATFAGRYPPQKAVAAARLRSEQKQWYAIRKMWDEEGVEDSMNLYDSQRSFWDHMRMHVRWTDEDYDSKAPEAWTTWKRDHLVRPCRQ